MNKPGLIGRKVGMTQIYDDNGNLLPVTVLEVGPCPIISIKTSDKDGYNALQIGYYQSNKGLTKPMKHFFEKVSIEPQKHIKEFRCESGEYQVG
jgi:large subunit ribosomal protein L3